MQRDMLRTSVTVGMWAKLVKGRWDERVCFR